MASIAEPMRVAQPSRAKSQPVTDARFDGIMVVLSLWFMTGLVLDGWAHSHHQVESFFTVWHLILYSGFAACAGFISLAWAQNMRKGYSWQQAIPAGYEMSAVGAVVFAVGGVFDLIWHTVFGIEVSFEALVSPSHLILACGLFLILNGPFRAAWRRADPKNPTVLSYLPMLVSFAFTLSVLTFFTFPLHPFVNIFSGGTVVPSNNHELYTNVGFAEILLQATILMGSLLMALRRWRLPFGSFTLVLTLNALSLAVVSTDYMFVPIMLITGLFADVLVWQINPSVKNIRALRFFAFAVPTVLYLMYFGRVALFQGVWWSVPLWGGAACLAGVVGLLLSYVFAPSPVFAVDNTLER